MVELAIDYAKALDCPRLHAMAGQVDSAFSHAQHRATYVDNIAHAASRCGEANLTLMVEPINPYDMPGYFLNDFDMAADILKELKDETALKLQFDIYHCAKIHGDVVSRLKGASHLTAHYQIAGIPDRHEPSPDTLPLSDIFQSVESLHPDHWIGCEYRPAGDTKTGLTWMPTQL